MTRQRQDSRMSIQEQAAHWLSELADGGPDTQAELAAWLRESPRHVEEFLLFEAMWKEFKGVDSARRIDVERLVAQAAEAPRTMVPLAWNRESNPTVLPAATQTGKHKVHWKWTASIAAAVAVLAIGIAWKSSPILTGVETYTTAIGEQRVVKLADGSFVHLNTSSRVSVLFSPKKRELQLLAGEALFDARRDPARPFRVSADGTVIQAVGTQFNVYRRAGAVTVAVLEGRVKVEGDRENLLAAGEEASIVNNGRVIKRTRTDIEQTVAWRTRRLVFKSDPLERVAAEFNRYNSRQIRVDGDGARSKKLIGTFNADDPESLLQFLAREQDLAVERGESEIVIRSR